MGIGLVVGAFGVLGIWGPATSAADGDCADGYLVRCQQGESGAVGNSGVSRPVGQLPRVQGVPCNGQHLGVCIAVTQAEGEAFPGLTTGPAPGPGAVAGNRP